ncbi:iron-siderophore ABC transporter substrate-binding protein [Glycomyces sp. TRM65418]|uniref:ABC transporter substrate-binding protein n=1 Tax=Glycomyces sp. TRM65418 TaxID=2867006 RepID=UPI001CE63F98|nr:iron-siderophore ABC transporter substrate-binding protein [Glycomyces sp. TRM65418]MCC3765783.1 iron-siderophore ABC transporter substrate-binding protein [Glycomyces sp. TRM65418]QZD55374.1 iron-siderophore ABC transporter substrate-binding protein [Glycomyces sp. TRM65418]
MRLPDLKRSAVPAAVAAALLAATACGTTENGADDAGTNADAGPVSVTDFLGRTVELDAPAEKVVTLEWAETEIAASLGVMPVGVADIEGYRTWVGGTVPLDDTVTDVGTRQEPSVDTIAGLDADLVIMEADDQELIANIEEFVPVLVVEGSNETDNLDRMKRDVDMIAELTGATAEAETLWADFEAKVQETADAIEAAGTGGVPYLFADGWMEGDAVAVRPFGAGSLVGSLGTAAGLENAWTGETDGMWGLGTTDLEGLAQYTDADMKFIHNNADGGDIFTEGVAGNAIWENLQFVKNGEVHELPHGVWTFGGPKSSEALLDYFAEVYAS